MAGAEVERWVAENIARPRSANPRQQHWIDPVIFVNGFLGLEDRRIGWSGRRIVTALGRRSLRRSQTAATKDGQLMLNAETGFGPSAACLH